MATSNQSGNAAGEALGLPQLDFSVLPSQLFWLAITFGILYFFVAKNMVPKISAIVEGRENKIKRNIASAEKDNEKAEKLAKDLEKKIATAKSKADKIIEEQVAITKQAAEKERTKIGSKIDQQMKESEIRVAKIKTDSTKALKDISSDVANEIFSKVAGVKTKKTSTRTKLKKAS